MRKMKIILAIMAVILLYWLVKNRYNITEPIKIRMESTPTEFENYQYLTPLAKTQSAHIRQFDDSFLNKGGENGDSTIWIEKYGDSENDDSLRVDTYYKISTEGLISDSLKIVNAHLVSLNNYLIDRKDGVFYTWLKDGDRSRKPIIPINTMDTMLTETEMKLYLQDAEIVCTYLIRDSEAKKVIFYKNRTWYEGLTSRYIYISESHHNIVQTIEYKNLTEVFAMAHFTKRSWNGERFPDFRLMLNGREPEHWKGTGFFNLSEFNEILNFRHPVKLYKNSLIASSLDGVYVHPSGNYLIIKGSNSNTLFLCRRQAPKKP